MATKKTDTSEVSVVKIERGRMDIDIIGLSPLILNRMSEKSKHELLCPAGRKNAADKASKLKHEPLEEFRASAYQDSDPKAPTLLQMMASSFKGAIGSAARDLPGATKTQVMRLTSMVGDYVHVYGIPKLFMSVVRSADMNKTPDIRTRVIVPQWACRISIVHASPMLKSQAVLNLLAASGVIAGVGDWRPEKGSGNYGQFEIVGDDTDTAFRKIVTDGKRAAQQQAMIDAEPYDDETAELLTWFTAEAKRRGFKEVA